MNVGSTKNNSWQESLMNAVTDPFELFNLLELDREWLNAALLAGRTFSLKVPRAFINQIKKRDLNDPLLKQVLPVADELLSVPGYSKDPLHEKEFNPVPGLLHKYQGRVLLTLSGTCAINCRYCFRRHFDYPENNPGQAGWDKAVQYIAANKTISEVILSGGDPLIVNDHSLKKLTEKLGGLSHIKRLRIHSRLPIVLPERITPALIEAITQPSFKTILVVHCNHPQELYLEVKQKMEMLTAVGVVLLNQSVLLKGINDDPEILIELSEKLFEFGIQPYYLHALDKVQGAAHFDLEDIIAKKIHMQVMNRLSGYLVPKLVIEKPYAKSKLPLNTGEFCTD